MLWHCQCYNESGTPSVNHTLMGNFLPLKLTWTEKSKTFAKVLDSSVKLMEVMLAAIWEKSCQISSKIHPEPEPDYVSLSVCTVWPDQTSGASPVLKTRCSSIKLHDNINILNYMSNVTCDPPTNLHHPPPWLNIFDSTIVQYLITHFRK